MKPFRSTRESTSNILTTCIILTVPFFMTNCGGDEEPPEPELDPKTEIINCLIGTWNSLEVCSVDDNRPVQTLTFTQTQLTSETTDCIGDCDTGVLLEFREGPYEILDDLTRMDWTGTTHIIGCTTDISSGATFRNVPVKCEGDTLAIFLGNLKYVRQ